MFALVFSHLPARLRRALAYVKAFAFLEDTPGVLPASISPAILDLTGDCGGDRRRGPGAVRAPRPGAVPERCSTARASAGRSGRPAPPAQRCATPIVSGKRAGKAVSSNDRRASVPGGFLHR